MRAVDSTGRMLEGGCWFADIAAEYEKSWWARRRSDGRMACYVPGRLHRACVGPLCDVGPPQPQQCGFSLCVPTGHRRLPPLPLKVLVGNLHRICHTATHRLQHLAFHNASHPVPPPALSAAHATVYSTLSLFLSSFLPSPGARGRRAVGPRHRADGGGVSHLHGAREGGGWGRAHRAG